MKRTFEEACSIAADLFEAIPETWTRRTFARDEYGRGVPSHDPSAVCWCTAGVLHAQDSVDEHVFLRLDEIAHALGYPVGLVAASDHGGRKVAIRMLRIAAGELPMPKGKQR